MTPEEPYQVVLIDDCKVMQHLLPELVERAGGKVIAQYDCPTRAFEALREVPTGSRLIYLIDTNMPGMDGPDLAKRLHDTGARGIVGMSASRSNQQLWENIGVTRFYDKEGIPKLRDCLENALRDYSTKL